MNRIDRMFARLKAENRKAFVTFTVACDPSFEESLERLRIFADSGIDLIEICHPYSDPILDGATIQKANRRGLVAGGSLARTVDLCAAFRENDAVTPLILMGYANPLAAMGYEAFSSRAAAAGIDGIIVADVPIREADTLLEALMMHGLVMIPLATPALSPADFAVVRPGIGGFLYCIPVVGPTGGPSASIEAITDAVERCRGVSALPILVGFGVKSPELAARVAEIADGVIVATALMDRFEVLRSEMHSAVEYKTAIGDIIAAYRMAIDH
ncbi:MAG: trpA 2 [Rhizobium sp.]|nr:trpA 2 [Rhizobium sp.]